MEQDISGENLNNMHWKNKLEDVEHLSTATLQDKNAAWEKLHSRLHQPPRRIKAIRYWAAAACLVIAIIVPLLTANKKQPGIVSNTNSLLPPATSKAAAEQRLPVKENVLTVVPANTKTVTIQTDQSINNKKINSGIASVKSATPSTMIIEQKDTPVRTIIILPVQIPVTEITTSVAVSEKKKLKVVHINELGDPVFETRNIAYPDDYGVIQFKLINQQVYNSSPVSVNSVGFNISKSKNVSSN